GMRGPTAAFAKKSRGRRLQKFDKRGRPKVFCGDDRTGIKRELLVAAAEGEKDAFGDILQVDIFFAYVLVRNRFETSYIFVSHLTQRPFGINEVFLYIGFDLFLQGRIGKHRDLRVENFGQRSLSRTIGDPVELLSGKTECDTDTPQFGIDLFRSYITAVVLAFASEKRNDLAERYAARNRYAL